MTDEQNTNQKASWWLDDAQAIADKYPYTFYKPSPEVISMLRSGNQVKLIFVFDSEDPEAPRAERMWVDILEITDGRYVGALDNQPEYIQDLKPEDRVIFKDCHIIDTDLRDPVPAFSEKFVKRCFVTNNILYEEQKVGYLYREEPDQEDDSGWRFTTGTETNEYMDDSDNISYVSLGAVLREDDSFVDLLEHEAGVHFGVDKNGNFVELD